MASDPTYDDVEYLVGEEKQLFSRARPDDIGRHKKMAMEGDSSEDELFEEQQQYLRPRRGAVCAEPYHKGFYYKMPFWNKFGNWEMQLFRAIQQLPTFAQFKEAERIRFVRAMQSHKRFKGEFFGERGEVGDGLFIVLEGAIDCLGADGRVVSVKSAGDTIDELSVLFGIPRACSLRASSEECVCGKLSRQDFTDLCTRLEVEKRDRRSYMLRSAKPLEGMADEKIAQLVDVCQERTYEPNEYIIRQDDEGGKEFFILEFGEAVVTKVTGNDTQEYKHYHGGEMFGELALMSNARRAANIIAVTRCHVLVFTRARFERLFGSLKDLQAQQYLTDPRKLIADFYASGDGRGPAGTLQRANLVADPNTHGVSHWFAVYRPTSSVAIFKMLSGIAVGKGLNVKGKSAKKGILSGFVPFVQISDNKHKDLIERSPAMAKTRIYYKTKQGREEAFKALALVGPEVRAEMNMRRLEDYEPEVFGLEVSESLMAEAYIKKPDLTPVLGWETGRQSEPALMDMNLHAVRETSEPKVVLYQFDESDPMNPRGLLVAYAEKTVKPVVSDFDTFTVGSKGMKYDPLPLDQAKIVTWALDQTEEILNTLDSNPWTARWFDVIKRAGEKGFHPKFPKFGFGDPTSIHLIEDIVTQTAPCGAIRHGAECCNFYFPQELDESYLVVWHNFPEKPWDYLSEDQLRNFLLDRAQEGYGFPLNPVWPVRDPGWYEVLEALQAHRDTKACLKAWYPPEVGILERMAKLHREHPQGFRLVTT